MKPEPLPPASAGRCGAQIPAAFAFAQLLDERVGGVLTREREHVRMNGYPP